MITTFKDKLYGEINIQHVIQGAKTISTRPIINSKGYRRTPVALLTEHWIN